MSKRNKKFWASFGSWIKNHQVISGLIGFFAAAGLVVGGLVIFTPKTSYQSLSYGIFDNFINSLPSPQPYYSPLTGMEVKNEAATKQLVTAIMIENSPDARPHSGLKESGVVFEAIAEGGITRYIALYQEQKPQLIGPVRSLRPYFLHWAAAFNASIAHIGGSAKALDEVRNGNYRDIDQFFNPAAYWRATDRFAPHNVYTSFAKLDALNKSKGYTKSSFTGFPRIDGEPAAKTNAKTINITISSDLYNPSYKYDKKTNSYARSLGGVAHKDREKGQIKPSVVIAIMVNEQTVFEDGYRQSITTIGSGKAFIFQNGTVVQGTWKKASKTKQIKFFNSKNQEVKLVRGQTWISAVPNGSGSVSWK